MRLENLVSIWFVAIFLLVGTVNEANATSGDQSVLDKNGSVENAEDNGGFANVDKKVSNARNSDVAPRSQYANVSMQVECRREVKSARSSCNGGASAPRVNSFNHILNGYKKGQASTAERGGVSAACIQTKRQLENARDLSQRIASQCSTGISMCRNSCWTERRARLTDLENHERRMPEDSNSPEYQQWQSIAKQYQNLIGKIDDTYNSCAELNEKLSKTQSDVQNYTQQLSKVQSCEDATTNAKKKDEKNEVENPEDSENTIAALNDSPPETKTDKTLASMAGGGEGTTPVTSGASLEGGTVFVDTNGLRKSAGTSDKVLAVNEGSPTPVLPPAQNPQVGGMSVGGGVSYGNGILELGRGDESNVRKSAQRLQAVVAKKGFGILEDSGGAGGGTRLSQLLKEPPGWKPSTNPMPVSPSMRFSSLSDRNVRAPASKIKNSPKLCQSSSEPKGELCAESFASLCRFQQNSSLPQTAPADLKAELVRLRRMMFEQNQRAIRAYLGEAYSAQFSKQNLTDVDRDTIVRDLISKLNISAATSGVASMSAEEKNLFALYLKTNWRTTMTSLETLPAARQEIPESARTHLLRAIEGSSDLSTDPKLSHQELATRIRNVRIVQPGSTNVSDEDLVNFIGPCGVLPLPELALPSAHFLDRNQSLYICPAALTSNYSNTKLFSLAGRQLSHAIDSFHLPQIYTKYFSCLEHQSPGLSRDGTSQQRGRELIADLWLGRSLAVSDPPLLTADHSRSIASLRAAVGDLCVAPLIDQFPLSQTRFDSVILGQALVQEKLGCDVCQPIKCDLAGSTGENR